LRILVTMKSHHKGKYSNPFCKVNEMK
jgi:hypothetical protein